MATKKISTTDKSKKYGKHLNPFQHALQRPDTYIGSINTIGKDMWVFNIKRSDSEAFDNEEDPDDENTNNEGEGEEGGSKKKGIEAKIVKLNIKYNCGLSRIVIELLSNAIDNIWRPEDDPNSIPMKNIWFKLHTDPDDVEYGMIEVSNDGYYIPVEKTTYQYEDYRKQKVTSEKIYPAEMFFGEMMAGTNFDDTGVGKKTSGKNGMGAKAANVFSKKFIVEHADPENKRKFYQEYRNNGKERDEPIITKYTAKTGYTTIKIYPDYERFGYEGLDHDFTMLMKKYAYDAAMVTGVPMNLTIGDVTEKILIKDLKKYAKLYFPDGKINKMDSIKTEFGDECVIVEMEKPEFDAVKDIQHISFINGIHTREGGIHVDAFKSAIFPILTKTFNSRKPKKGQSQKELLKATAKEVYPYFILFIRCESYNPKFNSQLKENLDAVKDIYSDDPKAITDKFLLWEKGAGPKKEFVTKITEMCEKMLKWNFVSLLEEKLELRLDRSITSKENKSRVAMGNKYTAANYLGGDSRLFIIEGLSAKGWADRLIVGMPDGRDYNGSLAIKGKCLNVHNASISTINKNEEVQAIKQVIGLRFGVDYSDDKNFATLNYGKIEILTDADDDGIHIRGLLLRFFLQWPALFARGAISSFSTTVVRVESGKKNEQGFYSNHDFRNWFENNETKKKQDIRYLKGLGSHEPGDEKFYLKDPKEIQYNIETKTKQIEIEKDNIGLAWDKKRGDDRKKWIAKSMVADNTTAVVNTTAVGSDGELDPTQFEEEIMSFSGDMSIMNFIHQHLLIYHKMVLKRALPSMYDGCKHVMRQALYGTLNSTIDKRIKLVTLSGKIIEKTEYHHTPDSLLDAIINMARGYIGTNNIPLFQNKGQYGNRWGDEAANPRYLFTAIDPITKVIFDPRDEPILEHEYEDGKKVEYKQYMPIVPMILINGVKGIGSGWATDIPCYNPEDLVHGIQVWLDDQDSNQGSNKKKKAFKNLPPLKPWYRGFKGTIELVENDGKRDERYKYVSWQSIGIMEKAEKGWWHITEFPAKLKGSNFVNHIDSLQGYTLKGKKKSKTKTETKKEKAFIKSVYWGTVPLNEVSCYILPTKEFIPDMDVKGNFSILKMNKPLTNIVALDSNGYPRKFYSAEELLESFCEKRLEFYGLRQTYWLNQWNKDLTKESNKYKFVKGIIEARETKGKSGIILDKSDDATNDQNLIDYGLMPMNEEGSFPEEQPTEMPEDHTFKYLIDMHMGSMYKSKLDKLAQEISKIKKKISELEKKTCTTLWREDLENFLIEYKKFLKTRRED